MSIPPERERQIAAFFAVRADELRRATAHRATTAAATIEDACAFAWMQLLRRPDVDLARPEAFGWLARVAVREAWRLDAEQRQLDELDTVADAVPARDAPLERLEHRERLALLQGLPARQARLLALHAQGESYEAMSAITGDSARTVDRQLRRARHALRILALHADGLDPAAIADRTPGETEASVARHLQRAARERARRRAAGAT